MIEATPNVVFVITDQQRADHCGFMGNKVVGTPNLDAKADPDELHNLAPAAAGPRADTVEAMMVALLVADDLARGAPVD